MNRISSPSIVSQNQETTLYKKVITGQALAVVAVVAAVALIAFGLMTAGVGPALFGLGFAATLGAAIGTGALSLTAGSLALAILLKKEKPQNKEEKHPIEENSFNLLCNLPEEVTFEIFSNLEASDLARVKRVNKHCYRLASDKTLWERLPPPGTIGKKEWKEFLGDVGVVPLPKDIHQIMNGPCPIWKGKKVRDTHMLVLIPKTLDGQPLTFNLLREKMASKFRRVWDRISAVHGDTPPPEAYWVLMTTDVLPGSRDKNYGTQQKLLQKASKEAKAIYEAPSLLEAIVSILMKNKMTGERLFSNSPWTFTRCQEIVQGHRVVVGGFAASGLDVSNNSCDFVSDCIGVAGLRKCLS